MKPLQNYSVGGGGPATGVAGARLKTPLQVTVQRSAIQFHMRGKQKCVSVETKIGHNQPDFRKRRGGFTLYLPGN
ncbi:UNVERIFIED_CONTAM: hypothetical protein FKN15_054324 [Acipenser sinensis]